MIKPIDFVYGDFASKLSERDLTSLSKENLTGSSLIDNLILLRFVELPDIQQVLLEKFKLRFAWLNIDPTPKDWVDIATKYNVFFQREASYVIVYVPLGVTLDDTIKIDIPNYKLQFVFIADCNYRTVKHKLSVGTISDSVANLRPLLILRRLVADCIEHGGTDIHFQSTFVDKKPKHSIRYRIKRELCDSDFKISPDLIYRVTQTAIAKLSTASASDLDAAAGVTTDISDLFGDGTCDLRMTGMRVAAGIYVVIRIQTTTTTMRKIDELGFPEEDVVIIRDIAKRRTGLTLVTGAMNTGKNTTIFAILNELINDPIRIIEYSNPIEARMPFPQINYKGDIELLTNLMTLAKKQDIDIAVLNEIPNSDVAFAVRDLVNSAIGVITTTHVDRIWHVPNKLNEFFGKDYKTIISQLNAIINQKMFRRWSGPGLQKRMLQSNSEFEKFAYRSGVRQYFVPTDASKIKYSVQPLAEILVITDEMKSAMLDFDELWKAERMLRMHIERAHSTIENKLAMYINEGICSLDELRGMF